MSDEEPIPMTEGEYFVLQDDGYFILKKGVVIFGECIIWGTFVNFTNTALNMTSDISLGIYLVVLSFLVYRLT